METIKNLQNDRIPQKQTNKQKTAFYVRSFIYLFIHLLIYFFFKFPSILTTKTDMVNGWM